jgi:nuclear RNA export factor
MSYRGRGRGRGGHNTGQQLNQMANDQMNRNAITVEVKGWQGGSRDDAISFISRKTRIVIMNSVVEGDTIVGQVKTQSEADQLSSWSGVRFAGNALKFAARSPTTSNTIEMLKAFLERRYNPQVKLLDLGSIASDEQLRSTGAFSSITTQSKMFPALMKLASQSNYDVQSVNLSDNGLEDLMGVSTLAQTYPNLLNLSLSNNKIARLKSLETWKNKFKHLRELLMSNNPITSDPSYKDEISKTFPKLVVLDGVIIRDEQKLKSIYELPITKRQFFFEDFEIQQLSTQFISNYLNFWDNDRNQLMSLYTPDSQFSLSADSSVPNDASATDISFGLYIPLSRNISRVSSARSRNERLGKGPEQIHKLFQQIPFTKHKLDTNPELYSMEAWRYAQVNGFIISIHGEFGEVKEPVITEKKNNYRRTTNTTKLTPKSFDRLFVIVPSGNGMVIASDSLIVRPIANNKAWSEEATVPTQQAQPNSGQQQPVPGAQVQLPPHLSDEQKLITQKIMMETKLNLQFSLLLCEQSNWNYEVAVNGFKESHANGQVPPEAFQ